MRDSIRNPLLIFDGDCPWCSRWVERAMSSPGAGRSAAGWEAVAFQFADLSALDAWLGGWGVVTPARCRHRLLWVTPGGKLFTDAQACAHLLMRSGGPWAYLGGLLALPPVGDLAELAAGPVVRHGHRSASRHRPPDRT
jgi:predicted DCC family thiol-disulfide oxidoreductase YuxK